MSEYLPDPEPDRWPVDPSEWVRELPAGTPVARIFPTAGPHPVGWNHFRSWGPTTSRFDHHPGPAGDHPGHAIAYAAIAGAPHPASGKPFAAFTTCLAEYYQSTRTIDPVPTADWLAVFALTRPLRLLDLGDAAWVTRAGGNAVLCSGPRGQSRKWASNIHTSYPTLDGVVYPSSVAPPGRALALWERAADALPATADQFPLTTLLPALEHAAVDIGYQLIGPALG